MTREEAIEVYHGLLNQKIKEAFEVFAPELRESEDERIRKWLIEELENTRDAMSSKNPYSDDPDIVARLKRLDEGIAYLEKQKENPKSSDSIPSDCVSDAKCEDKHNEKGDFVFELRQIISSHRYSDIYGEYTNDEEGMASEILELCKCELEKQKEQKPAEWSKNDTVFLNEITDYFEDKTVSLQHDLEMYAHWLKSLPERFNLQLKNEWSEEEKK